MQARVCPFVEGVRFRGLARTARHVLEASSEGVMVRFSELTWPPVVAPAPKTLWGGSSSSSPTGTTSASRTLKIGRPEGVAQEGIQLASM